MRRLALLVLILPAPVLGQSPLPGAVDEAARGAMAKQQLVGLAVGVVVDGKVAYLQGYGFADREAKTPVDPKATQIRWASCSKPVTAVAALQLAEKGLLDLDADVRRYVPEFPDKGVKITARQLLCHQAGIVHYTNGKVVRTERKYDAPHPFKDVVLALDMFKESPLVNPPGEKFAYTTHGYILLSAVVERAGKKAFADQVSERIAKPLGMTGFRPDYHWENIPGRAVGYVKSGEKINRRPDAAAPDVSWKLGGGGYTSTVEDFARFAAGLANHKLVSARDRSRHVDRPEDDRRQSDHLRAGVHGRHHGGWEAAGRALGRSGEDPDGDADRAEDPAGGRGDDQQRVRQLNGSRPGGS